MAETYQINRTNDYAFKRIFGSEEGKEALLGLLNAILETPSEQKIADVELLDRGIDPAYLLDRGARLDILAKTAQGILINIEIQVANQYNIDKRTLFYWAGLYQGQLTKGQQFSQLRKTITINILSFNWFSDKNRYHHTFHVWEDDTKQMLNDDLEIHFLETVKVKDLQREPQNRLEAWMMYLNNLQGEEMEAIAMENPGIRKAMTIEQIFFKSDQERRIYELREKAQRDHLSSLAGARAEGEARGEAKGEARGKAAAHDAICMYLDVKFGPASLALQDRIRGIDNLEILKAIINKIYTAKTLDEAGAVVGSIVGDVE